jgi:hypothetical protein
MTDVLEKEFRDVWSLVGEVKWSLIGIGNKLTACDDCIQVIENKSFFKYEDDGEFIDMIRTYKLKLKDKAQKLKRSVPADVDLEVPF